MVVVRFSVLVDKVRSGEKKQTIRPFETYQNLEIGDPVHCYSVEKRVGVRRPVLKELLYVGTCTEIIAPIMYDHFKWNEQTSKLDGFKDTEEMRRWFESKYPDLYPGKLFRIIRWE